MSNKYDLYEVGYIEAGVKKELIVSAKNISEARRSAVGFGFHNVISVKKHQATSLGSGSLFGASIQVKESFLNRIKFFLESGETEYAALKMIAKEETDSSLKRKYSAAVNLLEKGMGFSDALLVTGLFNADDISFLSTGERVGYLSAIKVMLARIDEGKGFRKILKAFAGFVLIEFGMAITLPPTVAWSVVPWVESFIADMTSSISPDQMEGLMIQLEQAKMYNLYLFFGTLFAFAAIFTYMFLKNSSGKEKRSVVLSIPIAGDFIRHSWLVSQSKALGMLLDNGVNLPDTLALLGSKDKKFPGFWKSVRESLEKGLLVHDAFRKGGIMYESDIGMIQAHKNVKHLSQIFHKLSDYHSERQSELQRRLLQMGTMFFFAYIALVIFVSLGVYNVFQSALDISMSGMMNAM